MRDLKKINNNIFIMVKTKRERDKKSCGHYYYYLIFK